MPRPKVAPPQARRLSALTEKDKAILWKAPGPQSEEQEEEEVVDEEDAVLGKPHPRSRAQLEAVGGSAKRPRTVGPRVAEEEQDAEGAPNEMMSFSACLLDDLFTVRPATLPDKKMLLPQGSRALPPRHLLKHISSDGTALHHLGTKTVFAEEEPADEPEKAKAPVQPARPKAKGPTPAAAAAREASAGSYFEKVAAKLSSADGEARERAKDRLRQKRAKARAREREESQQPQPAEGGVRLGAPESEAPESESEEEEPRMSRPNSKFNAAAVKLGASDDEENEGEGEPDEKETRRRGQ
eukprot:GAFH01001167.1.p2 GENE.GAFH01001167.1~~GAFH01001167.1.p2  ORF type:complete len:330 (+),score=58.37 GAFH01001167.1:99-992(+)